MGEGAERFNGVQENITLDSRLGRSSIRDQREGQRGLWRRTFLGYELEGMVGFPPTDQVEGICSVWWGDL